MNNYEIMYILNPTLDEAGIKTVRAELEGYLTSNGAKIDSEDVWGLKELAYEMNKFNKGYYVVINVTAEPNAVNEFDRLAKINKSEIRHMIIAK